MLLLRPIKEITEKLIEYSWYKVPQSFTVPWIEGGNIYIFSKDVRELGKLIILYKYI